MVALAGLEEGIITNISSIFCPGYYKLPNVKRKFNDWKKTGHGHVNVKESIAQSCDVFFYDLANKPGIDKLHNNLNLFNFGRKTNIDIPGEKAGILPSKTWKKLINISLVSWRNLNYRYWSRIYHCYSFTACSCHYSNC